jgi:hypothetical protein
MNKILFWKKIDYILNNSQFIYEIFEVKQKGNYYENKYVLDSR